MPGSCLALAHCIKEVQTVVVWNGVCNLKEFIFGFHTGKTNLLVQILPLGFSWKDKPERVNRYKTTTRLEVINAHELETQCSGETRAHLLTKYQLPLIFMLKKSPC